MSALAQALAATARAATLEALEARALEGLLAREGRS